MNRINYPPPNENPPEEKPEDNPNPEETPPLPKERKKDDKG